MELKLFNWVRTPWVVGSYLLLIILMYLYVDKSIVVYLNNIDFRDKAAWLNYITFFGNWEIYAVLFFLNAVFFRYAKKNVNYENKAWFLFGCIIIPTIIVTLLKVTLGRARPDLFLQQDLFGFYWFKASRPYWSCPSGHTMTITALAIGISSYFPRYCYLLFSLILVMVLSRILLYQHYLSDVLFTFWLTLFILSFYVVHWQKRQVGPTYEH